jgi:hypothetical protein
MQKTFLRILNYAPEEHYVNRKPKNPVPQSSGGAT